MDSIWAEIRTSVLSRNPISSITWLSMEKKKYTIMIHGHHHRWQGSKWRSTVGCAPGADVAAGRGGHPPRDKNSQQL